MLKETWLKQLREYPDHFEPQADGNTIIPVSKKNFIDLLDEITALRKIAEAANDVGYSWSLANYPHPTVAKPMYILNEALKEWRGGGDDK